MAHLRFKADLFVSCGVRCVLCNEGRADERPCSPEAANISNMAALVDSEGKPHFKWIVEGTNLFINEKRKIIGSTCAYFKLSWMS